MDPYSPEGELFEIHNAYHQGQYAKVAEFEPTSFSSEHQLLARVLVLRARIALGQTDEVLADLADESDQPELAAVAAFAQFVAGDTSSASDAVDQLVESSSDHATVQVLCGTILQGMGKSDEALALLSKHEGNLEAVALIVQIHLQQNRTEQALKEVNAAKRWAQDSLLVNLAESWVGLRLGGEKYKQAYYFYEELAQAPATSSTRTLVGQAVAEVHLGRLPEAQAALQQAAEQDADDSFVLANTAVCSIITGKDAQESLSALQSAAPDHALLHDLEEKSSLFDELASNYSAKVTA
ncbi:MAG: hypothetical protein M1823_001243 [Watsoniomyces obsoletus]|nr:MAG: hypothetical protein M1823_001243 [Watsoniomyces obsoletus]